MLEMHANHREERDEIGAGDDRRRRRPQADDDRRHAVRPGQPVLLESIDFPEPVIDVAVEPKTKADQDKLATALGAARRGGPDLPGPHDEETGQTIIAGMGELHLEIIVDRLMREFRVRRERRQAAGRLPRDDPQRRSQRSRAASSARPAAAASTATSSSTSSRTSPAAASSSRTRSSAASSRASTSRRSTQGIKEAMEAGVLAGYPVVDIKVTLVDGSYHDVDSSEMAFKIAGSMAFKDAPRSARSRCCSSPSWRSRWSRPRSTWATSSATSTRAAATSRAWSRAATRRSSAPACRWPRCSATPPMCAP